MFTETTAALDPIESTTTGGDVDDARWQAADDLLGRIASNLDAARPLVKPCQPEQALRPTDVLKDPYGQRRGRLWQKLPFAFCGDIFLASAARAAHPVRSGPAAPTFCTVQC